LAVTVIVVGDSNEIQRDNFLEYAIVVIVGFFGSFKILAEVTGLGDTAYD
jgi:hypothetical protein